VHEIFSGSFGNAGASIVIEEFMEGEEASLFVLVDGETILPIGTAQDHKRVGNGDTGLNTGGMGAYSPAPILNQEVLDKTIERIIRPTMREMVKRGMPFTGVLYAGLMIRDSDPRLVEFNVRFGDPECQVLMMRLGGQILDALLSTAKGKLSDVKINWANDHSITVVMASNGYPGSYKKGTQINGLADLPSDSNFMCFHAGTVEKNGKIVTNGGRVLNITTRAETLVEAQKNAYEMMRTIDWPEGFYRNDIGWKAL
jgi:phosphoribosylamine--glycine ligase